MAGVVHVRLGPIPWGGRSAFGLAGADTEESEDEWRREMGGKTHENGVSVLRARRHPDVPGAYVLMEPHFEKALYGVRCWDDYLATVVPSGMAEDLGSVPVLLVEGSVVTCCGGDGRVHADLGSDGEFLIDTFRPHRAAEIAPALVWVDETRTLGEFLGTRMRGLRFR